MIIENSITHRQHHKERPTALLYFYLGSQKNKHLVQLVILCNACTTSEEASEAKKHDKRDLARRAKRVRQTINVKRDRRYLPRLLGVNLSVLHRQPLRLPHIPSKRFVPSPLLVRQDTNAGCRGRSSNEKMRARGKGTSASVIQSNARPTTALCTIVDHRLRRLSSRAQQALKKEQPRRRSARTNTYQSSPCNRLPHQTQGCLGLSRSTHLSS